MVFVTIGEFMKWLLKKKLKMLNIVKTQLLPSKTSINLFYSMLLIINLFKNFENFLDKCSKRPEK